MREVGIVAFPTEQQRCSDFSFPLVSELCGRDPFPMEKEPAFGSEPDYVILFQLIKL